MKIAIFASALVSLTFASASATLGQTTVCIPALQGRTFVSMDELLTIDSISVCSDNELVDAITYFDIIIIQQGRDAVLPFPSDSRFINNNMREALLKTDPSKDVKVIFDVIRLRLKDGTEIIAPSFELETR
jgi:hypothetical protein